MKSSYITLVLLILPIIAFTQNRQSDSIALVQIYEDMGGSGWTNNEGWLTASPLEDWNGITTDGDRVTKLQLSNIGVNGILSDAIYDMTGLTSINIFNGTLTGELSEDINNLTELRTLALERLGLSGSIPNLHNFEYLNNIRLSNNEFTGSLPTIPSTSNLIRIGSNQLTGTIPESWMGNELNTLDISVNGLEGSFDILSTMLNIKSIGIDVNNWDEGPMPEWLDDMPILVKFFGSDANFIGDIPEYDFSSNPNFNQILLNNNNLTGDISNILNGVSNTVWIDAKGNLFEGELPIDKFQNVFRFDLSNNNYTSLANPDAPIVNEVTLRGNAFKISTLLPHMNEFPIDSMEVLYYNSQDDIFATVDTTLTTAQTFTLDAGDDYEGILYQWIRNNQPIEGANNRFFDVDATEMSNLLGRYNCVMTHPDLTTNQGNLVEFERGLITIRTDFVSNTKDNLANGISIYPNPTANYLYIESNNIIEGSAYQLIAIDGKIMQSGTVNRSKRIDVRKLVAGEYYLQLVAYPSNQIVSKKVVKL